MADVSSHGRIEDLFGLLDVGRAHEEDAGGILDACPSRTTLMWANKVHLSHSGHRLPRDRRTCSIPGHGWRRRIRVPRRTMSPDSSQLTVTRPGRSRQISVRTPARPNRMVQTNRTTPAGTGEPVAVAIKAASTTTQASAPKA
jgi:hypothetical protein